jgi:hypothetical protein
MQARFGQGQGRRLGIDSDDEREESLSTRGWDAFRLPTVSPAGVDVLDEGVISAPVEPRCISRRTCWKRKAHHPRASRSCCAGSPPFSAICVEGLFGKGRPLSSIADTEDRGLPPQSRPGMGAASFPDCVGKDNARSVYSAHSWNADSQLWRRRDRVGISSCTPEDDIEGTERVSMMTCPLSGILPVITFSRSTGSRSKTI